MSDTDERRAGSIILRDLALFSKAVVLFEDKMEPAIITQIADLVREWQQKHGWQGNSAHVGYLSDLWVCPGNWNEESAEPLATFRFCIQPGIVSRSYDFAELCGVGQAAWGFKFEAIYSWFGGKSGWNTFARGLGELGDGIVKRGWVNAGKGVFFRPVKLNAELLASAWETEDWDGALAPIEQALDAVLADQHLFDQLITRARIK